MRLGLLWVGRTRDRNIRAAIELYIGRIGRYLPVEVTEVKEEAAADRHSGAAALRTEGRRIREKLPRGHEVVLLDVAGRSMSSEELARFLERRLGSSSSATSGVTFVIGGHQGVDDETRRRADHALSLSRMTLTHEIARLLTVEQIYRALTILGGGRYHR
ncbi:MAG TPA: 23S rRNA (pseudouridine(1915)-N(3))-methyltransferase RlmH [Candidatus Polarisedimenticolia bacterium]|nr:23S rRNA (pseudouridine(1915)-N(3))-methyltransferase RlmH [Candidatus Polarisedimenticolia bacterium]